MRMVLGKSWINRNSFRLIGGRPENDRRTDAGHRAGWTITRIFPESIQIVLEHPKTVPGGLGSVPEGSRMSRNHPGMSRNGQEWSLRVLEGSGSFREVPRVSGQYHMGPTTLSLGG